jgi:glycosyltransferase involved in cell wall biosynthesis
VTQSFRENLIRRGIDGAKIQVVTNGIDLTRFRPLPTSSALRETLGIPQDAFVAGYIGTHGMAHALETVLEAAQRMRSASSARSSAAGAAVQASDGKPFHFILLGDGAHKPALKAKAAEMGLTNVHFLDTVPKAEVPRYWSLLDVSIIHLKKEKAFQKVIPSKLFECMGMGIPVLHGVAGESAEIVEREGVGLVFEPENAQALCDGLLRLAEDQALYQQLHEHCLAAAPRYDRSALALKMLGVLAAVAHPNGSADLS